MPHNLGRSVLLTIVATAGFAWPHVPGALAQEAGTPALEAISPNAVLAGEVIVTFKAGTSDDTRDQVLALVQGSFVRALGDADTVLAKVPAGTEVSAAESLRVDPNVVAAEPNAIADAQSSP